MAKLIIHGGAGSIAPERREAYIAGLGSGLQAGWAILEAGGEAVEAVLVAVEAMERNRDAFNAGIGGSPNRDGEVELDACVMRGADGSAGAVAAVSAKALAERYAAGGSLPALMTRALDEVRGFEGKGGLIAISAEGEIAHAFDTANLAVAWTDGSQALVAVLEQPERER